MNKNKVLINKRLSYTFTYLDTDFSFVSNFAIQIDFFILSLNMFILIESPYSAQMSKYTFKNAFCITRSSILMDFNV